MDTFSIAITLLAIAVAIALLARLYLHGLRLLVRFFLATEFNKSRLFPLTIFLALVVGFSLIGLAGLDVLTGCLGLLIVITALLLSMAWEPQRKRKPKSQSK